MANQINNHFEEIVTRLESIEGLLHNLKIQPGSVEETPKTDRFLSTQEAAAFLRISVPTIYSKVSRGDLSVMKKGNRLYFSESDLAEYLKSGKKRASYEIQAEADNYLARSKKGGMR